jgi:Arc/MetJ-type ribon-helix-helix transcriptional regulator
MNRIRITVEINENLQKGIENAIRQNYPKLKTVSDVVRASLEKFLQQFLEEKHDNQKHH